MENNNSIIPTSNWLKKAQTSEGEEKVASEFVRWLTALQNSRLAAKASRL